jgi:hypothetical protein
MIEKTRAAVAVGQLGMLAGTPYGSLKTRQIHLGKQNHTAGQRNSCLPVSERLNPPLSKPIHFNWKHSRLSNLKMCL